MIHLDTSFLILALLKDSAEDRRLRAWLTGGTPLGASAIVWAEFLCGPVQSKHVDLAMIVVQDRVPFTEEDATLAASLFNDTGRRRGSLANCMIAATAIRCDAELATTDTDDFAAFRHAGLIVADGWGENG